METYSLDLSFTDDRKRELCDAPIAEIYVKTSTRRSNDGDPLITPECMSLTELEYHIGRLQGELEAIRKKAKTKFKAEAART